MAPEVLLGLLAASFGASFITAAFGIGGGVALLAVMATLVPPAVLIPVHGIVQVGSNVGRAAIMLRWISWPAMPAFAIGSAVGAALGGMLVVSISPALVQLGLGLFIIWSVVARPPRLMRRWSAVTGAISSFLTMFFGATGLFVATYTKALELERHGHVATHAALMTVQHAVKTVAFGLLGFAFGPWLPFVAAMIAAGFAGTVAGRQVLTRLGDPRFKIALNTVLFLLAARLIWSGSSQLLAGTG
ncbi:sulfite exporter TauE/SafE family protein [Rhodobacteraceae bacterium MCCB 386]|nr:sulfite exporter TauE/SafE family protein [Roseitranquillus sediminis]